MSESKQQWTPGPWRAIRASHGVIDVFDANDVDIVTIFGDSDEHKAKAKLIAAAPELVEALSELLEYGLKMSGRHHAPAFEKARAALAKAGA